MVYFIREKSSSEIRKRKEFGMKGKKKETRGRTKKRKKKRLKYGVR